MSRKAPGDKGTSTRAARRVCWNRPLAFIQDYLFGFHPHQLYSQALSLELFFSFHPERLQQHKPTALPVAVSFDAQVNTRHNAAECRAKEWFFCQCNKMAHVYSQRFDSGFVAQTALKDGVLYSAWLECPHPVITLAEKEYMFGQSTSNVPFPSPVAFGWTSWFRQSISGQAYSMETPWTRRSRRKLRRWKYGYGRDGHN